MPAKHSPPAPDELEISVFGPGYGESILIHVGRGAWIAIDSCIDPVAKRSAPISYLSAMGIDPADAIELVVASHWHADHIAGLHDLLSTASSAKFSCASTLTGKEFLTLAKLYSGEGGKIPRGPEELFRCLETADARAKATGEAYVRWANPDRLLWKADAPLAKLTALSPSDAMTARCIEFMASCVTAASKGIADSRLMFGAPNDVAVALLLEVGGRQILLGSDLEEESNPLVGWSAVMAGQTAPGTKSETFKVAHHGSVTGHHDPVWDDILQKNALALLTPFRHGKHKLPNPTDRARILARTPRAYISADPGVSGKAAKKAPKVQSLIDSTIRNRRAAVGPVGHIRWRAPIDNLSDPGVVDLFDGALPLADVAA